MTPTPQLLADIHLKVRFGNYVQRNPHLPVGSVFKKNVVALYSQQTTAKVALAIDRLARLHLRLAACKSFEVSAFVQAAFEAGRRYLQRVRRMNKIFHVENRSQVQADFGAILVGHTLRLVNEYTNNRLVLGAGYLGVHQLEAMIDCDLFS